ncbi:MAG: 7-cyano-7-deazaguanine synthase QueC [Thermoplasmata archaeon]
MPGDAVVLLSGGLDSSTVLAYAISIGYSVHALSFDYGQRHKKELESGKKIAEYYGVDRKVMRVDMRALGGSALTDDINVPERNLETISEDIPVTYVPARNTIFLSIAAAYAETMNSNTIFIGANAIDYSGYPDCRPEYFNAMEKALSLGTKLGLERGVEIKVPLQYLSKADIVRMGEKLKVPYDLTWSCYNGEDEACGRCDSCLLRLKGFMEAGYTDPIKYEKYPSFYTDYLKKRSMI